MESKNIECIEWINVNRNARLKVHVKEDNFKKNKSNKQSQHVQKVDQSVDSALYLIQVVGQEVTKQRDLLACLTSDQIVNIYDGNLKPLNKINQEVISNKNLNEMGFYKKDVNMVFTCGDQGTLNCWDLRTIGTTTDQFDKQILQFKSPTPREFLCADINSDDNLFAIGTNKNIDDAQIYIFDIRYSSKHLYNLCESHSQDITQVKFDPTQRNKFSSASTDGLVCLYDINEETIAEKNLNNMKNNSSNLDKSKSEDGEASSTEDDPDFMEQVFNTDSSIFKMGYLSSNDELAKSDKLFAITYTNGLFVWDLDSHDVTYRSPKEFNKANVQKEVDEAYYFDCFYKKDGEGKNILTTCRGDKQGNIKTYQNDSVVFETTRGAGFDKRFHKDIIRSSYWSGENMFTCGEDGFLLKWAFGLDGVSEKADLKQKVRRDNSNAEDQSEEEEVSPRKTIKKGRFNKNFKK